MGGEGGQEDEGVWSGVMERVEEAVDRAGDLARDISTDDVDSEKIEVLFVQGI